MLTFQFHFWGATITALTVDIIISTILINITTTATTIRILIVILLLIIEQQRYRAQFSQGASIKRPRIKRGP